MKLNKIMAASKMPCTKLRENSNIKKAYSRKC